jgi:hypothetical protein
MGRIARRIRSVCPSMLETLWAIETSYMAGALPAQADNFS